MAQIEQSDGGKKKKGAQKKMQIHVDFTPMVDMNMLLITFFMLCTTMIKSQTLSITLPVPPEDNVEQNKDNSDTAAESRAITLIVDTKRDDKGQIQTNDAGKPADVIYYYHGLVNVKDGKFYDGDNNEIQNPLQVAEFIGNEGTGVNTKYFGIRDILRKKNKVVVDKIEDAKQRWRNKEITEDEFNQLRKEAASDKELPSAQVSIKATDRASWESVISALDEMQLNGITQYRIGTFNPSDSTLIADYKQRNGIKD